MAADFLISVFEIIGTGVIAVAGLSNLGSTSVDIVITIIAFIMSFYTAECTSGVGTIIFDLLAMVLSGCALIKLYFDRLSIKNQINNNLIKNKDQTLILTFALVISGIAASKSCIDVVVDVRDYASE